MKITAHGDSHACLAYDDEDGERVLRSFSAPAGGGYVREVLMDGSTRQVCRKLRRGGPLLYWNADKPLIALIRSEYRAAKRI